ncbi:MAG: HDIG domain-containing protein [Porphyromonas sp.]|nr:HDIG domain-containing protein [Porphyromonas sp.]
MNVSKSTLIKRTLFIIGVAILITICYPRKVRFMYDYVLDQPWRYEGVLTAPYDYTVYKSDAQLSAERDSVERTKVSYYLLNEEARDQAIQSLTEHLMEQELTPSEMNRYLSYLTSQFNKVYSKGILSSDDYNELTTRRVESIYVIGENNVAKKRELTELYTYRQAYEYIMEEAPSKLEEQVLQQLRLEQYLQSNLKYDAKKTSQMLDARLATISEEIGRVQKGQRIVGTGDVVTPDIYQELEGYRRAHESMGGSASERWRLTIGQFSVILFTLLVLLFYLVSFHATVLKHKKDVIFVIGQMAFFVILTYLLVPLEPITTYMIPYSMVAVMLRIFMSSRTAFATHVMTVLLSAMVVPAPLEFVLMQVIAGAVIQVTLSSMSERSDLIKSSFASFFSMVVVVLAYHLAMIGGLKDFNWTIMLYLAIQFIFLMFSYVMVYIFERLFGYVSSISLVELSDINKPLLRQLSEVAPGTFQHSLNVSILASEAADRIGGDVRLIRLGALYHDIGKMKNPTYFTENQGTTNPHDQLSEVESAKVIIRHVTDGVEMAEKAKLPQVVIDFIRTHHGLGMTKYFYINYKNDHPDEVIDESLFHYPGPNPFTREQGILMMADAVEASSRSLKDLTEQKIANHIDKIVDGIVNDGLLKNTPLTFRDIETTKHVFNEKLRTMYHSRIEYPELASRSAAAGK